MDGIFNGWIENRSYGFIHVADGKMDIFVHMSEATAQPIPQAGDIVTFDVEDTYKGKQAKNVKVINRAEKQPSQTSKNNDAAMLIEDIEELDMSSVDGNLLEEISSWKREAKAEDSDRYFWHVREVDQISRGEKYFVIGRKGSGKTAICEYFNRIVDHNVFSEKLSFKQFPFNELYSHNNKLFTAPNQYITIWKYLIYNTICRLLLKNEAIDSELREELSALFGDNISLSRRVKKWVGKEFGFSLFGISVKITRSSPLSPSENWTEYVDYVEDILMRYAGNATYYILFDELDEDYRDVINADQYNQYTALITSLFKAVQDIRTLFGSSDSANIYPVIFLRDDIYEIVKDSDKNKWGDFRVDLNWDPEKMKRLIAFRISRALDPKCEDILPFPEAWEYVFGKRQIGIGSGGRRISTFEYISRSTLMRPRDFVAYLQNCAEHAIENNSFRVISPTIVKIVDKAFSNYLREELTDELFAILPDIAKIFDAISQLRKWNFSIPELEDAYRQQVEQGVIVEKNFKFVLQVLFMFDVIGNTPRSGWYVFRYQNREARLNFKERVVVHRGLFKALQII